jgi:pimeloyl-ACP methyl ester carboxylesterase
MPDVHARGLRFKVHTMGRATALTVLIHGIGIDNSSSHYFLIAPALSHLSSVVCYDLRGHGESEVPDTGYTFEQHVLDLSALLDELGVNGRPVSLVGTSLGGRIALEFALRFPDRVDKIALLDSELIDLRDYAAEFADHVRQGPKHLEEGLQKAWEKYLREHTVEGKLDHDASLFKTFLESRTGWKRTVRLAVRLKQLLWETSFVDDMTLEAPPTWDELAEIQCPVLALYGDQSNVLPTGKKLSRVIPQCSLTVVPDCGHFVIYKADVVRDELQRFIAGTNAPA